MPKGGKGGPMGLKILHTADWHLDTPFRGFSEGQRELLREELRKIPGKAADLCRRENCDLVLLAGDIFDGPASRETLEEVQRALARCGVPVLVAPGNHDFCGPASPWLEERWPENVYIFTGDMEAVTIEGLDCRVYGAGYRSMDCPALLENFRAEGPETYKLALLHGDPLQKNSPNCPITAAQVRASGLTYLALGHIHKAGTFQAGGTLCAWPGCPMGRGWDETGDKGMCIVTLGEKPGLRAVSLDAPRFLELTVDIGTDALSALENALPAAPGKDFYRVHLTGRGELDMAAIRSRFESFPNLELFDEAEPPLELWSGVGEDTLEGAYFRRLKEAMEENPASAETIRLAAEISRRILDGREVTL